MKLKKVIAVSLMTGLCLSTGHSLTVKASVADTVINNLATDENDTSCKAIDVYCGESIVNSIVSQSAIISEDVKEVVTGCSVEKVAEAAESDKTDTKVNSPQEVNATLVASTVTTKVESTKKAETTEKKSTVIVEKEKKITVNEKSTKKLYSNADLRLMSCIIYAEANGEPYAGKLAVGIVVMNRKSSKSFPNTVKGVIYQKYQFGPVRNGALNRALKEYDAGRFTSSAEKACVKAAKEALSGVKKVTYNSKTYNMKNYYFFSTYVKGKRLQIKHHQFK